MYAAVRGQTSACVSVDTTATSAFMLTRVTVTFVDLCNVEYVAVIMMVIMVKTATMRTVNLIASNR